ncbi:MAG TPA: ABC transporter substrate-binding protein [Nevskia sp.]|nr:ABC transporter substrate-binding protein [Nevskia sp.]
MLKLLVLSLSLLACGSTAPLAAGVPLPDAALKDTVSRLLGNLSQHGSEYRNDDHLFYEMIDLDVVPRFDVPGIAKFALGRNGRAATPDQRLRFADALALALVHSYAKFMLDCGHVDVIWLPVRMEAGADQAQIKSVLTVGDSGRYMVTFSVRRVDDDWKVYDLEIDGVSLAINYRVQLNEEIKHSSLDAVIARLGKPNIRPGTAAPL